LLVSSSASVVYVGDATNGDFFVWKFHTIEKVLLVVVVVVVVVPGCAMAPTVVPLYISFLNVPSTKYNIKYAKIVYAAKAT
jgi:hypothetical protein